MSNWWNVSSDFVRAVEQSDVGERSLQPSSSSSEITWLGIGPDLLASMTS